MRWLERTIRRPDLNQKELDAVHLEQVIARLSNYRTRTQTKAEQRRAKAATGITPPYAPLTDYRSPLKSSTLFRPPDYAQKASELVKVLFKVCKDGRELSIEMYQNIIRFCAAYGQVRNCERLYDRMKGRLKDAEGGDRIRAETLRLILLAIRKRATSIGNILSRIPPEQNVKSLGGFKGQKIGYTAPRQDLVYSETRPTRTLMNRALYEQRVLPRRAIEIAEQIQHVEDNTPVNEVYTLVLTTLNELGRTEEYNTLVRKMYGIDLGNPAESDVPDYADPTPSSDKVSWLGRLFGNLPSRSVSRLVPDTRTLNDWITFLGRQGRISDMMILFEVITRPLADGPRNRMTSYALVPNSTTFDNLIRFSLESDSKYFHLATHYLDVMRRACHALQDGDQENDQGYLIFPSLDHYDRIFRAAMASASYRVASSVQKKLAIDLQTKPQGIFPEKNAKTNSQDDGVSIPHNALEDRLVGIVKLGTKDEKSLAYSTLERMTEKIDKTFSRLRPSEKERQITEAVP